MSAFNGIAAKEQDLAGNWRVWVDVGGDELIMLKFDLDPDEALVQAETARVLAQREA